MSLFLGKKVRIFIILLPSLIALLYLVTQASEPVSSQSHFVGPPHLQPKPNHNSPYDVIGARPHPNPAIRKKQMEQSLTNQLLAQQNSAPHRKKYTHLMRPTVPENISFVIAVLTNNSYRDYFSREAIRQTWAAPQLLKQYKACVIFVVGFRSEPSKDLFDKLKDESDKHNDILYVDIIEHYTNRALKSLEALRWFTRTAVPFFIKADIDVLPVISSLHRLLLNTTYISGQDNIILGNLKANAPPIRQSSSEWFLPKSVYPATTLPTFISGLCYIATQRAVKDILAVVPGLDFLYLEDVFITGLGAEAAHVQQKNVLNFLINRKEIPEHRLIEGSGKVSMNFSAIYGVERGDLYSPLFRVLYKL